MAEEIGLELPAGRLLAVDWLPAWPEYGPGARPSVFFVFDGGILPDGAEIALQYEELDEYRLTPPGELPAFLPPPVLRRARAALAAQADGGAVYLPQLPG